MDSFLHYCKVETGDELKGILRCKQLKTFLLCSSLALGILFLLKELLMPRQVQVVTKYI